MAKWRYALFCVFIQTANFHLIIGQSYLPKWSDQVEAQLRFAAVGMPGWIEATIYFDKERNALTVLMREMPEEGKYREATSLIYRFDDNTNISISGLKCDKAPNIERGDNSIEFLETTQNGKKLKDFGSLSFFDPQNYAQPISFEKIEPYGFYTKWQSFSVNINSFSITYCNLTHYLKNEYVDPETKETDEENYFSNIVNIEGSCEMSRDEENIEMQFEANFFESKNSISNAEIFQQPPGVYCPFLKTTRDYPPMPPSFSFNFLTFDSDDELGVHLPVTSFRKKIWYDSSNKLIRKDNLNLDFDVTVTMVSDFDSKLSYIILSPGECTINEMKATETMENEIALPGENFPLFPGSTSGVPQYVGQRKRYGVTFDVWVNRNEIDETVQISDYYFTSDVLSEDNRNVTTPAFIEMFIFNPENRLVGSALQLISEYRTKPSLQDQVTFDVTRCFPESNKTRFFLTFSTNDSNEFGVIDQTRLTNDVREKLLSVMKVNKMRLGAIQISFMDENVVTFSSVLVEDPTRLGFKEGTEETSNQEAMKGLDELINDKNFLISVDTLDTPSKVITLNASNLSYPHEINNKEDKDRDKPKDTKKHKSGFSGGALAGVAIAMLAVGMFQGIVLLVAYIRYRRNDPLVRRLTMSEEIPEPKPESS